MALSGLSTWPSSGFCSSGNTLCLFNEPKNTHADLGSHYWESLSETRIASIDGGGAVSRLMILNPINFPRPATYLNIYAVT